MTVLDDLNAQVNTVHANLAMEVKVRERIASERQHLRDEAVSRGVMWSLTAGPHPEGGNAFNDWLVSTGLRVPDTVRSLQAMAVHREVVTGMPMGMATPAGVRSVVRSVVEVQHSAAAVEVPTSTADGPCWCVGVDKGVAVRVWKRRSTGDRYGAGEGRGDDAPTLAFTCSQPGCVNR